MEVLILAHFEVTTGGWKSLGGIEREETFPEEG
jgi:hypothetical protein